MAGRFARNERKAARIRGALTGILLLAVGIVMALVSCGAEESTKATERFELRLQEDTLLQVTDAAHLQQLKELLGDAVDLGYEPKTYILGPVLVYIGTDGQEVHLELDLDSDLFRYQGRFFDYGPGNDNNAMPELLGLLGLEGWPEEVRRAFSHYFASLEEQSVPVKDAYQPQSVYMDLWYPDWRYLKIPEEQALVILEALRQEEPVEMDREKVPVEDCVFTIHIAYDDGREYDLACVGENEFLMWEGGKNIVYGFSGTGFRKTVDDMIALSMELAE